MTNCGGNSVSDQVKIGLALGGGFARGIAHFGVLQVLCEQQVPVHLVAGTSAGSLVGAMFCAGLDPWLMERAAERINWRALVRLKLRRDGLLDPEGLERFLLGNVGDLHFDELKIPMICTATDLNTGEEVLLGEGRVATAVRASCAFPGIFLPVRMGGRTLVDGGLVNNVPTTTVRRMGADVVIAVDLNRPAQEQKPPRNLLHIMLYSLALLQRPQIEALLKVADVVIQPDLSEFGVIELERVHDLCRAGREATEAAMVQIRAAIARAVAQKRREPRVAVLERPPEVR
jgi:NTE family protein